MTSPRRTILGGRTEELLGTRNGDRALRLSDLENTIPGVIMRTMSSVGVGVGGIWASAPGPYADDAAAAASGISVGEIYLKSGGTVAWRVS